MAIILLLAVVVLAVLLTVSRPVYGLVTGMLLMYNPVYSFLVINMQGFEEAKIRVGFSLLTMGIVLNALLFHKCVKPAGARRFKTPVDKALLLLIPFLLFSSVLGVILGHPVNEVLAALFPFVEGLFFFFVTGYILKDRNQVRLLYILLSIWIFVNFLPAILLYLKFGSIYFFKLRYGTVLLGRLTDFMVALLCPMLFAYFIHSEKNIEKKVLLTLLLLGLLITVLGSYRSIWLGVAVSFIYIAPSRKYYNLNFKKVLSMAVVLLLVLSAVGYMWRSDVFENMSLVSIITNRLSVESLHEGSSYAGRLSTYYTIFRDSFDFPYLLVGHGFGSEFEVGSYTAAKQMQISSAPNFFLNVLYETGFISASFIFGIGVYVLSQIRRVYKNALSTETKRASLALIGGVISIGLVFTMFPAFLHFPIIPLVSIFMALTFFLDSTDKIRSN